MRNRVYPRLSLLPDTRVKAADSLQNLHAAKQTADRTGTKQSTPDTNKQSDQERQKQMQLNK